MADAIENPIIESSIQEGRSATATPPPAHPKIQLPAKPAVIGTHVKRLDGPDKVTGRARYTFDIKPPGMLYGRIVRSPHPHARVISVDLSAAQRAPGVKRPWSGAILPTRSTISSCFKATRWRESLRTPRNTRSMRRG